MSKQTTPRNMQYDSRHIFVYDFIYMPDKQASLDCANTHHILQWQQQQ